MHAHSRLSAIVTATTVQGIIGVILPSHSRLFLFIVVAAQLSDNVRAGELPLPYPSKIDLLNSKPHRQHLAAA